LPSAAGRKTFSLAGIINENQIGTGLVPLNRYEPPTIAADRERRCSKSEFGPYRADLNDSLRLERIKVYLARSARRRNTVRAYEVDASVHARPSKMADGVKDAPPSTGYAPQSRHLFLRIVQQPAIG
jgi:hypothetical protein